MISKQTASYNDISAGRQCGACDMFKPEHSCTLVSGVISRSGTCRYWEKRKDSGKIGVIRAARIK